MKYSAKVPKFVALANDLRAAIEDGRFRPGDVLPSGSELADLHGMSRPTVSRAIELLKADGLVVGEQGRGTVVLASQPSGPAADIERLTAWLREHYPRHMTGEASAVDVAISLLARHTT